MADSSTPSFSYAYLSEPNPAWQQVAEKHVQLEALMDKVYRLPIEEFRKLPYKPAGLPDHAPVPGQDLNIRTSKVAVRDGHSVAVRIYEPLELRKDHLLIYNVHGGGWTVGIPETEEAQNRFMAAKNDAVVVSVDYRKAPEFPFPTPLNDSFDVLKWCMGHAEELGADPKKIILTGGSAGANLCAALTLMARDDGLDGLVGQILNIPVTCHPKHFPASKYEYNSYVQNAKVPIVNAERMHMYWNYYLPNAEPTPLASPLLADSLAGLPPALIQVAGMDPLRDEGLAYAEALKQAGVETTVKVYPGMPHAFYVYPNLDPTTEYFKTMVGWVDDIAKR